MTKHQQRRAVSTRCTCLKAQQLVFSPSTPTLIPPRSRSPAARSTGRRTASRCRRSSAELRRLRSASTSSTYILALPRMKVPPLEIRSRSSTRRWESADRPIRRSRGAQMESRRDRRRRRMTPSFPVWRHTSSRSVQRPRVHLRDSKAKLPAFYLGSSYGHGVQVPSAAPYTKSRWSPSAVPSAVMLNGSPIARGEVADSVSVSVDPGADSASAVAGAPSSAARTATPSTVARRRHRLAPPSPAG